MRDSKIFTAALLTAKSVKFTYREKFQVYGIRFSIVDVTVISLSDIASVVGL